MLDQVNTHDCQSMMKMSDIFQDMYDLAVSLNPQGKQKVLVEEGINDKEHKKGERAEFPEFEGGGSYIMSTIDEMGKVNQDELQKSIEELGS